MQRRARRPVALGVALAGCLSFGTAWSGCRDGQADPPATAYAPVATLRDVFVTLVGPAADVLWGSARTVIGPGGVEENVPRSDEEWLAVRYSALRMVEAANLLMMPGRRAAAPGARAKNPGIELEPEEIDALIAGDWEGWIARVQALQDAGLANLRAIDAKDDPALFDVGEQLHLACEGCHTRFWYPNQALPPGYENRDAR